MINLLQCYFNNCDSTSFELRTDIRKSVESEFVYLQLTFLHSDYLDFHYFHEEDRLDIWCYSEKKIYQYNKFSELQDEAYHFQQLTLLDHISFEPEDVTKMMKVLNGIRKKYETEST